MKLLRSIFQWKRWAEANIGTIMALTPSIKDRRGGHLPKHERRAIAKRPAPGIQKVAWTSQLAWLFPVGLPVFFCLGFVFFEDSKALKVYIILPEPKPSKVIWHFMSSSKSTSRPCLRNVGWAGNLMLAGYFPQSNHEIKQKAAKISTSDNITLTRKPSFPTPNTSLPKTFYAL